MLAPVLANPVTGHVTTILASPLSGDPGPLVFDLDLPAGAVGSPPHRHAVLRERFQVLDGMVEVLAPGGHRVLGPGEGVVVAPGETHAFRNASGAPARLRIEVSPGHDFERFLRATHCAAVVGRTSRLGLPRDLRALAILLLAADVRFAWAPMALQRILLRALAALHPGARAGRIPNAALAGRPLPRPAL